MTGTTRNYKLNILACPILNNKFEFFGILGRAIEVANYS